MEHFFEQSVAEGKSLKKSLLYALCCLGIAVFLIAALICAANVFGRDPSAFVVNWWSVVGLAIGLVASGTLFMCKDHLRMEYDYIYRDGMLEICGVLNRRRRKRLATIDLQRVTEAGPATSDALAAMVRSGKARLHRWYGTQCRYYLIYMEENVRHAALLELDEQLAALIRRRLPAGAWRDEEGKN